MGKRNTTVRFDGYISLWNTDAYCTVLGDSQVQRPVTNTYRRSAVFLSSSRWELDRLVYNSISCVGEVYITGRILWKYLHGGDA